MKKALIPQPGLATSALLSQTLNVIEALTGNPDYPTPGPSLAAVQAAYDALAASSASAAYGSRQEKATARADKETLLDLLRNLAAYINYTAAGDEQKLAGCGLPLSKTPQPVSLGVAQPSLEYSDTSGELTSATPAVEGAVIYKHQYSPDPEASPWLEVVTSRSRCKLVNLTPGVVYNSRIVAIGNSGQMTISDIVTKMAV